MMARCGVLRSAREPPDSHRARGRKAGAHVAHGGWSGRKPCRRAPWLLAQTAARERAADALCLKARGAVRAGGRGGRGGSGGSVRSDIGWIRKAGHIPGPQGPRCRALELRDLGGTELITTASDVEKSDGRRRRSVGSLHDASAQKNSLCPRASERLAITVLQVRKLANTTTTIDVSDCVLRVTEIGRTRCDVSGYGR